MSVEKRAREPSKTIPTLTALRMPRPARARGACYPHHGTQRGDRCKDIFYPDWDRVAYLTWLGECAQERDVEDKGAFPKGFSGFLRDTLIVYTAIPDQDGSVACVPSGPNVPMKGSRARHWLLP